MPVAEKLGKDFQRLPPVRLTPSRTRYRLAAAYSFPSMLVGDCPMALLRGSRRPQRLNEYVHVSAARSAALSVVIVKQIHLHESGQTGLEDLHGLCPHLSLAATAAHGAPRLPVDRD